MHINTTFSLISVVFLFSTGHVLVFEMEQKKVIKKKSITVFNDTGHSRKIS